MAHPNRPADSRDPLHPENRFILFNDAWAALVRVGVALRRDRRQDWNPLAGLNGLTWFTAVIIAVTFGWMFRLLILRRMNLLFALDLVLLAVSASTIHFLRARTC